MAACTSLGLMMMKRWTKSGYTVLLGKPRRQILMPKEVHAAMPDLKACTKIILESIEAMNDKWRIGHTKVFFRAGAVGCVEEERESYIRAILNYIQGLARGYCSRMEYKKLIWK